MVEVKVRSLQLSAMFASGVTAIAFDRTDPEDAALVRHAKSLHWDIRKASNRSNLLCDAPILGEMWRSDTCVRCTPKNVDDRTLYRAWDFLTRVTYLATLRFPCLIFANKVLDEFFHCP